MTIDERLEALAVAGAASDKRLDALNDNVKELTHELRNGVSHQLTEIRRDLNVLTRRMDELPARLERQIRVAVARDQARAATALVERLEQEAA